MIRDGSAIELLTVLGPTASGKTRLAVALAGMLNGEVISADSRQVFRGMDIGSGKDLHEYGDVRHHLIDILDAGEEFSVFQFQRRFLTALEEIRGRGNLPILCGGSGMYLDAVLRGYRLVEVPPNESLREELSHRSDAELLDELCRLRPGQHNSTDLLDRRRTIRAIEIARGEAAHGAVHEPFPDIRPLVIGIEWHKDLLRDRITERLRVRLESGMIDEVDLLHSGGVSWERLDYYGLEYRYIASYLRRELSRHEMFQKLAVAIHNFAKRQRNWFRRMERDGVDIIWIDGAGDQLTQALQIVRSAGIASRLADIDAAV